eukprot:GCRY01004597.1.p1 GENE.GCRY01004597.1~~GCRY01004597.1.p1  ORF type:complete len:499 (-),score=98.37 GCRY01004597.1:191-1687(-)
MLHMSVIRNQIKGKLFPRLNLIIRLAILSRIILIFLCFAADKMVKNYDSGTDILLYQDNNDSPRTFWDGLVLSVFEMFAHWDSTYFLAIAKDGYLFEQFHAFYPLFPAALRILGHIIVALSFGQLSLLSSMLVGGVLLNFTCFVGAACFLYKLGCVILQHEGRAYHAAVLFCVNPASIFFTALYTESIFALFSFAGMFYYAVSKEWVSTLFFLLASCARSNGFILTGFLVHGAVKITLSYYRRQTTLPVVLLRWLKTLVQCVLIMLPTILFSYYGYTLYCKGGGQDDEWCSDFLPNIYTHVQSKYWGVGFFAYYKLQQIPNFILATPIIFLGLFGLKFLYFVNPRLFFKFGFEANPIQPWKWLHLPPIHPGDLDEPSEQVAGSAQKHVVEPPSTLRKRHTAHSPKGENTVADGVGVSETPVMGKGVVGVVEEDTHKQHGKEEVQQEEKKEEGEVERKKEEVEEKKEEEEGKKEEVEEVEEKKEEGEEVEEKKDAWFIT